MKWSIVTVVLISALAALPIRAADYRSEQEVDAKLGILNRPWKINYVRVLSRDYLRTQSQVKTGLPSYDQQVENAQRSPAVLWQQLTTTPAPPVRAQAEKQSKIHWIIEPIAIIKK
jgi:hypothetical protein